MRRRSPQTLLLCVLLGCASGAPDRRDAGAGGRPDAAVLDGATPRDASDALDGEVPDRDAGDAAAPHDAGSSQPPPANEDEDAGEAPDAASASCADGTARGDCGCPGEPGAAPAGSACDDGACVLSAECDGDGRCGSQADCAKPDPGCGPQREHAGHIYYVCPLSKTWADAHNACAVNPRFDLIRVDDAAEQAFLEASITSLTDDVWLNATDMTGMGQWGWMDDGTIFWKDGASVDALFENWGPGEPSANSGCVRHAKTDAVWRRSGCTEMHFFACEAAPP